MSARERGEARLRGEGESHAAECRRHAGFERPVGVGEFRFGRFAPLGAGQAGRSDAVAPEQVGDGFLRGDLDRLAEASEPAADGDAAGLRRDFAGDQFQERRFSDAVPADEPGPEGPKFRLRSAKRGDVREWTTRPRRG